LEQAPDVGTTPGPTVEQLEIIRRLDPHGLRATVLKGNPPGVPAAAGRA
jgi:glutaconate CoA-transferase subunit B